MSDKMMLLGYLEQISVQATEAATKVKQTKGLPLPTLLVEVADIVADINDDVVQARAVIGRLVS